MISLDDPDLAFVIANPWHFFPGYDPAVEPRHLKGLEEIIGLSVVQDLVSLQGGRVWTDEADGGGARFMVEFPLVEEPAGADAVAQEVAS